MRAALSRFLTPALIVTGGITAAVFLVPDLVSIGMLFLIVPGLILSITPTVFLYLVLFSLVWFRLSRQSVGQGIVGGLTAVGLVGVLTPVLWNQVTASRLSEAQAEEKMPAAPLALSGVVALQNSHDTHLPTCSDLCQTLLYDAKADRVLILPSKGVSFRIQPQADCPDIDPRMLKSYYPQWLGQESARVEAATRLRIANGECLIQENWSGSPDWVIDRVDEDFGYNPGRLIPLPGEVHAEGLQLLSKGRVIARQAKLTPRTLTVPLILSPRGGAEMKMLGWEWARVESPQPAIDARTFLAGFTPSNLQPDIGPADPDAIRQALDKALENPSVSASAFAIVGDYYHLFDVNGKQQFLHQDAQRLARLIADPRVTSFWQMPVSPSGLPSDLLPLRDPILDRMLLFAEETKWDSYRALDSAARRLPEGAFAKPDPRVDRIVTDPDLRRAAPGLVGRLSDRGRSAAAQLAEIATQPWGERKSEKYRVAPGNPNDDTRAAIDGLCRLGPEASRVLPQLRQAAAAGIVPPGIQDGTSWRAMLISLGVPSSEFSLPKNTTGSVDLYRRHLERDVEQCRKGSAR